MTHKNVSRHGRFALLALLCGCETSTVALGSECATFATRCPAPPVEVDDAAPLPAPLPPDASAPTFDAAQPEAPPSAEPAPEDAGVAPWLVNLANGGFEVTAEDPDDLGDLGPRADTEIAPWQWCNGDVEVHREVDDREPTEGRTLLRFEYLVTAAPALGQALSEPLVAGHTYALAFDADRSRIGAPPLRIRLFGGDDACDARVELAASEPIQRAEDERLAPYCLQFVAPADLSHLVLAVDPLSRGGRVYLDHLRPVSACP